MEKTYYIKFEGYCGTTLQVIKVEASSYEEAEKKAIEKWLSDIDISETDESEYKDYRQDEFISSLLSDDYDDDPRDNNTCPYCGKDADLVDSDEDSAKFQCHHCGKDFLIHDDGTYTTRNGAPIKEE